MTSAASARCVSVLKEHAQAQRSSGSMLGMAETCHQAALPPSHTDTVTQLAFPSTTKSYDNKGPAGTSPPLALAVV